MHSVVPLHIFFSLCILFQNRFLVVLCLVVFVLAKSDVVVIGHRGHGCSMFSCSSWLPENSIPAFLQGRAEGADRVELDTWLTADGKIIVAHGGQPSSHGDLVDSVVAPSGSTPRLEDSTLDVLRKYAMKMPWSGIACGVWRQSSL